MSALAARQMNLFPGRSKKPPPALEFAKVCVVVDIVTLFLSPGWQWSHLPFGEYRLKSTAGKLKRMGVKPGWPDYLFVSPDGRFHCLEMKRAGERGNPHQEAMRAFFERASVPYLMSSNVDQVLSQLKSWGVLRPEARW